jgi:hypothetical protein
LVPGTSKSVWAQASKVAPVVTTSSISNMCLSCIPSQPYKSCQW